MPHRIIYEYIAVGDDTFRSFRVLWEPYTNRVALHFRNHREWAKGLVGTPEETIRYLDDRARSGPPWDSGAPREARHALAELIGKQPAEDAAESPPDLMP